MHCFQFIFLRIGKIEMKTIDVSAYTQHQCHGCYVIMLSCSLHVNNKCYVTDPCNQNLLGDFHLIWPIFMPAWSGQTHHYGLCLHAFSKGFDLQPGGELSARLPVPVTGCWGSQCHGVRSICRVMWISMVHPRCASHTVTIPEQLTHTEP